MNARLHSLVRARARTNAAGETVVHVLCGCRRRFDGATLQDALVQLWFHQEEMGVAVLTGGEAKGLAYRVPCRRFRDRRAGMDGCATHAGELWPCESQSDQGGPS